MKKGRVVIISGPSGSGKTTLHKMLLKSERLKGKLVKSVSVTTRPRRAKERQGRDYLFISKKSFLDKIKKDHFLEWERVFDNYYGTPKKIVEALLNRGKNILLCIDVKGAKTISHQFPDAVKIFITVPTLGILKKRLIKRGSETQPDLQVRLNTAQEELKEAKKYQYLVVNDQLSRASRALESILQKELI